MKRAGNSIANLASMRTLLQPGQPARLEDIRKVNGALLPLMGTAVVAALWIGWKASAVGPVLMWAVACVAAGALTGFLFGIPRAGSGARSRSSDHAADGEPDNSAPAASGGGGGGRSRPNTNLEEVSDWLTKILVGLTLVNLGEIEQHVASIARNAAAALNVKPGDAEISVATALIVAFAVIGFMSGYLYTRLFLQGAIRRSDDELEHFNEVVVEELTKAQPSVPRVPQPGEPSVPSPTERSSAERVARALPPDRPDVVLAPLRALAKEYLRVREELPFSDERTRRMTEIARRMKTFALAAIPYLSQLQSSSSPGERLAAVISLQMNFDPESIEWLAERLPDEAAFIGYQAASALLARIPSASARERARICEAVEAARRRIPFSEDQRDKLIERIIESCGGAAGTAAPPPPLHAPPTAQQPSSAAAAAPDDSPAERAPNDK